MNRTLIDTHVFVWSSDRPDWLTPTALDALEVAEVVFLSLASCWEMAIKHAKGRLPLDLPLEDAIRGQLARGLTLLPIELAHVLHVERLPRTDHRDPFDRLLIAQAIVEDVPIVSKDPAFDAYGIQRIW